MQDIAGCRIVVASIASQDRVIGQLKEIFDRFEIDDRRKDPSHGYRAVHVIVDLGGKLIEIQVRTSLQHMWAEVSEKISDIVDPRIKYGEGNEGVLSLLSSSSDLIRDLELAITAQDTEGIISNLQRCFESFAKLGDVVRHVGEKNDLSN